MGNIALVFAILCAIVPVLTAGIVSGNIEYKSGEAVMEGYFAYDDSLKAKIPAVIIVHEWNGLGEYVKSRALQAAGLGYFAFCADIYGKGVRPKDRDESARTAGEYRKNRQLMRQRIISALNEVKANEKVDGEKIAVMGYCFGGGVALELFRSGIYIPAVISFHGSLGFDQPAPKGLKTKVLAFHGAEDKAVGREEVSGFEGEMRLAGADWQLVIFGGAEHGFTNPMNKAAYNEAADRRSWKMTELFLKEVFGK